MNVIRGRVWKFGDNIDTDVIIPFKYKAKTIDPQELAQHVMEGIDPSFSKKVIPDNIDAIRALTKLERDWRASVKKTDESLRVLKKLY